MILTLFRKMAVAAVVAGSLAATAANAATYFHEIQRWIDAANRDPAVASSSVTVIVETAPGASVTSLIASHGGKLRYRHGRSHEVSIPAGRLAAFAGSLPAGAVVRPPYPHHALAVTGQGVARTGAADMQALGINGAGVKVGVIDLGFASLNSAQASGDLPAGLTIVDYTGTGNGGIDHGTNVAQIVHEMAPGAQLYLAKIDTDVQLQQAMNDMAAAGVRVINHSVGWYGAAFYDGTGPICDVTTQAAQSNIQWVNAAGNERNRHYLATLSDADGDLRHDFTAGQNYNTVSLSANSAVTLILNWDAYPTTSTDYNLYLYNGNPDSGGVQVAKSDTRQGATFPQPYEVITYTPTASGTYYIVVKKYRSTTPNLRFTLFALGVDLGVKTTSSSLAQPADCADAVSVGAVDLNDTAEYFSAEGPTTDGRNKPDISGPDRVQTSLTGLFAGTSAASPHVAGAAALLMAKYPAMSMAQIESQLTGTAKDVGTAGFDTRTGFGRISLDADGDGVNHDADNCDLVANANQLNTDGDGSGNACDADDDNDGLADTFEATIGTSPLLVDTDGDGLSDYAEVGYDGNYASYVPGADLNPLSADSDGDGIGDATDPGPLAYNYGDGDVAPSGSPDGVIDAADLVVLQRIVLGELQPNAQLLAHGDVYPVGAPDGVINMSDLIVLLGRVR